MITKMSWHLIFGNKKYIFILLIDSHIKCFMKILATSLVGALSSSSKVSCELEQHDSVRDYMVYCIQVQNHES